MTVPGVGVVVALSVWAAIDDPGRFAKSPSVGAYLGLTPRRYASGEIDRQGRITKRGDPVVRTHLYEAANVLLTRIEGFSALKAWGLKIAKRSAGARRFGRLPELGIPAPSGVPAETMASGERDPRHGGADGRPRTPLRATRVRECHAAAAPDSPPLGADHEENLAPGEDPDQATKPLDRRD